MRLKRPPPLPSIAIYFKMSIYKRDYFDWLGRAYCSTFTNSFHKYQRQRESNTMQTCSLWHPHLWIISSKNKCKYQLKLPNRSTNNQTTKFLSIVNKELNEFIDDDDDAFYYGKRYHLLLSLVHRIHAHCMHNIL